jgi:hypothetical protein
MSKLVWIALLGLAMAGCASDNKSPSASGGSSATTAPSSSGTTAPGTDTDQKKSGTSSAPRSTY